MIDFILNRLHSFASSARGTLRLYRRCFSFSFAYASANRRRITTMSCLALALLSAPVTHAATFFWDGGGADTDILTNENWNPDGAPAPALNTAAAEGVAQLHFAAGVPSTVTSTNVQLFGAEVVIDAGAATPYMLGSTTTNIEIAMRTGASIIDNENTATANINMSFNLGDGSSPARVATIKAGNGDIVFDSFSGYLYNVSTNSGSHRDFLLGKNITLSSQMRLTGVAPINVYGGAGTATLPADTTGVLTLNGATGTANSNNNSNLTAQVHVWSGKLRIGNNNALGRTSNNTFVHGTFPASTSTQAQLSGGYEHGFGTLELYNNVALSEVIRIDSRVGDVADTDMVNNVSDNNSISAWNTQGGAGRFNFRSTAGTLTIGAARTDGIHVSDATHTDSTASGLINSVYTFRGDGNFNLTAELSKESGFGGVIAGMEGTVTSMVRKQGIGSLTLSNLGTGSAANDWDGGTLLEGGSIVVVAGGSFPTAGEGTVRTILHQGTTLDASATTGLSFGANTRLGGRGTVKGNVTTTGATALIQPGGTGSITSTGPNSSDALSYTGGSGILTLNNGLNMNAGGGYSWNLDALDAAPANAGASYDQLLVNGALTLGGSSILDLSTNAIPAADLPGGANDNSFWHANHSWVVLDQTNGVNTEQFSALTLFGAPNAPIALNGAGDVGFFSLGLNGSGDPTVNYTFAAVPEPATMALVLLGLVGLAGGRKGRR